MSESAIMSNASMVDAVQYAAQIGRLDFLTAVLASLAVALVFGGIFAFLGIRSRAKAIAAKVAEKHSKTVAERVANEYMQQHLPAIMQSYEELVRNTVGSSAADQIAQAQDEDNNENDQ